MLDKINCYVSYIFTSKCINTIDKKITSLCTPIHYKYIDETTFIKIFKTNYKKIIEKDAISTTTNKLTPTILKQFYQIYVSNKYNIGNTISQIKYHISTEGVVFIKDKNNKCSLLSKIALNFIKKHLILSTISSALELRRFLYVLLSLNIKLIIFVKEVVKQLIDSKLNYNLNYNLNNNKKEIIIEKTSVLSTEINKANKEIIIVETFFYNIITILFDDEL